MKKYTAPQAQIVNFDNDYVTAAGHNQNPQGCEYTKSGMPLNSSESISVDS